MLTTVGGNKSSVGCQQQVCRSFAIGARHVHVAVARWKLELTVRAMEAGFGEAVKLEAILEVGAFRTSG